MCRAVGRACLLGSVFSSTKSRLYIVRMPLGTVTYARLICNRSAQRLNQPGAASVVTHSNDDTRNNNRFSTFAVSVLVGASREVSA